MKFKINVTQKHIDKGESSATSCPIALALLDAGYDRPWVICNSISFRNKQKEYVYISPTKKTNDFIDRFDDGLIVKPAIFTLIGGV